MMVVLKHLANEYDIDPYKLRQKLRAKFGEAPGGRWRWEEKSPDLAKIRKFLDEQKPKPISVPKRTKA